VLLNVVSVVIESRSNSAQAWRSSGVRSFIVFEEGKKGGEEKRGVVGGVGDLRKMKKMKF
jgi:hypothetical protein